METQGQILDRLSAEYERNRIRDYIRETYGVAAEVGQRVAYTYREYRQGTIVGFIDSHLLVTLDGETEPRKYHPTWEIEYMTGPRRIEWCGVCNAEIRPGQAAEFGAPRTDEWTGVHLECPSDATPVTAFDGLRQRPGDQPLPYPQDEGPVIHDLVAADLAARLALGVSRYGTPLRAHNGRDALRDLYEELLDAAVYARQLLEERRPTDIHD